MIAETRGEAKGEVYKRFLESNSNSDQGFKISINRNRTRAKGTTDLIRDVPSE